MAEAAAPPLIAGVDEAGRGPLAGRVYAAAVILGAGPLAGRMLDSKRHSAPRRERLYEAILAGAVGWSIAWAEVEEIDRLNILNATLLAMRRAVAGLTPAPAAVLVDGNRAPELPVPVECVIGGDARHAAIGAASILAKVARDRYMQQLALEFPAYGFAIHKGYPTAAHLAALRAHGASPVHRRSFAPVRALLE